jgi:ferredoxin-NADP reductase
MVVDNDNDITNKEIFVCGPPPMMKGLISQFISLGIKPSKIHSEEFSMS